MVEELGDKLVEIGMKPLWVRLWLRLVPVAALNPPWGFPSISAQALVSRFIRGSWSFTRLELHLIGEEDRYFQMPYVKVWSRSNGLYRVSPDDIKRLWREEEKLLEKRLREILNALRDLRGRLEKAPGDSLAECIRRVAEEVEEQHIKHSRLDTLEDRNIVSRLFKEAKLLEELWYRAGTLHDVDRALYALYTRGWSNAAIGSLRQRIRKLCPTSLHRIAPIAVPSIYSRP